MMATTMPRLHLEGRWFIDESGRRVILRGVNLGGDCKVPYPEGGTNFPSDFSDHREVSFIGRPFPLNEATEHFARLRHWGFNCVRMLTTWEAVEHRGPGEFDTEYLDYYAELCRRAGDYGLYVFVDFHQDVWSRMSGGDGAPGWMFEKVGIDYRRLGESESAHVMQNLYDYARGGRQEERYPTMSWSQNAHWPANGIMWTLFFAGSDFAPGLVIDGLNVQDYMQEHYLASQAEIARRVRDLPNVMGFDTLNEPHEGWIGHSLSYRHLGPSEENPFPAGAGLAWSPIDGLLVAHGSTRKIPVLGYDKGLKRTVVRRERAINERGISIWQEGRVDPFEQAGAWRRGAGGGYEILRDDFFQRVGDRKVNFIEDYMGPFFTRVAENMRAINPDWILFAELDPLSGFLGPGFPAETPENSVNAGHWYDIVTLGTKTFRTDLSLGAMTGETAAVAAQIQTRYEQQLGRLAKTSERIGDGVPTMVGEFGIPFDLNGAEAYRAFRDGDRTDTPWTPHIVALDLMYNALDALLINSTHWNYTASNRNDLAIGDGWNQEDLSIFSRDQQTDPTDLDSGGRALAGFVRPFARATQGTPRRMKFDRLSGAFEFVFDADPNAPAGTETEIFVPRLQYPRGYDFDISGGEGRADNEHQRLLVTVRQAGEVRVALHRR
jgi:Glycoside hydrolase family 5 C-terminal domain/Cellulase (glycosyl hydrolase family 5)